MKYLKHYLILVVTIPVIFIGYSFVWPSIHKLITRDAIVIKSDDDSAKAQEIISPSLNLLNKIEEAKQLLKKSPALKYTSAKKQIGLAILNKDTGEVFEKIVWVRESDIKAQVIGGMNLEPDIKGESLDIRATWWNSFNTVYMVSGHPNLVVIANKYLYPSASVPYPQERSKKKYSEIIYAPFSEVMNTPEIIQAGKDHVDKMVDSAYESLNLRKVQSKSEPGKLVTEVVNKDFIKNIIVVEHIDPSAFSVSSDSGKILSDRVLAIIGANGSYAYSYTGSPAGASGIAQFIKSTYDTTRKNYPSAGLLTNFNLGMADHMNAFKSMVLFFDSHQKELENKITRKDVLQDLGGVPEEMLALAYNGGPGKVVKSVNSYGLAWISGQLNMSKPTIFRPETIGYFNKFKAVKSLNIF